MKFLFGNKHLSNKSEANNKQKETIDCHSQTTESYSRLEHALKAINQEVKIITSEINLENKRR